MSGSFEKLLAGRYECRLNTYQGYYYLHIKDTKEPYNKESLGEQKSVRRISFTADGLKALALVLPEILRIINRGISVAGFQTQSGARTQRKRFFEEEENPEEIVVDGYDTDLVRSLVK